MQFGFFLMQFPERRHSCDFALQLLVELGMIEIMVVAGKGATLNDHENRVAAKTD